MASSHKRRNASGRGPPRSGLRSLRKPEAALSSSERQRRKEGREAESSGATPCTRTCRAAAHASVIVPTGVRQWRRAGIPRREERTRRDHGRGQGSVAIPVRPARSPCSRAAGRRGTPRSRPFAEPARGLMSLREHDPLTRRTADNRGDREHHPEFVGSGVRDWPPATGSARCPPRSAPADRRPAIRTPARAGDASTSGCNPFLRC